MTQVATSLEKARLAIVGLGLMGGSLALALKGRCRSILGIDPDPEVVELALQMHLVEAAVTNPGDNLSKVDLVVLAAPVKAILRLIAELPRLHTGQAVVLDLGSTKTRIVEAMENLPQRFDPVGGHPMCGKEMLGLENAEASIYEGAVFALVALPRTSPAARSLAEHVVQAVGARPVWLEAGIHDRWVAATSHLPYLVASALTLATPQECAPLIGPGFRSSTRLAATHPSMLLDVLATNRANILDALERLKHQLESLETWLTSDNDASLAQALFNSAAKRVELQAGMHSFKPDPPNASTEIKR